MAPVTRIVHQVLFAAAGIGTLAFNFTLALKVEEAYAAACLGRQCPSIAENMYLLKVGIVITALLMPFALAWIANYIRGGYSTE